MSQNLICLPNEIFYKIVALLSPLDLSILRNVCKKTRYICDQTCHWKNIVLNIETNNDNRALWNLKTLSEILRPHRFKIEAIHIRGVRDTIMQYILLECPNLKELSVYGWLTLSDHAFRIPLEKKNGPFLLQKLSLVGYPQQNSNFISLDSYTLGQWVGRCPYLEELSVNCKVHFHAEELLCSIKTVKSLSLKSIVVGTKNTWSSQHITQMFQYCNQLQFLGLIPDSASLGYQDKNTSESSLAILLKTIVFNKKNQHVLLEKHTLPVAEEEIAAFHNIAIFSNP